jgi:hypothetical protein
MIHHDSLGRNPFSTIKLSHEGGGSKTGSRPTSVADAASRAAPSRLRTSFPRLSHGNRHQTKARQSVGAANLLAGRICRGVRLPYNRQAVDVDSIRTGRHGDRGLPGNTVIAGD